ncbi:Mov34/MPN/PAD-1 family protein [Halobaculum sp. MBLA0147]|uniref:Mov34/MPN/PAD-1 family protein n=1 Tax=Halobaculum sp. MBLA0147 TaxID=3079934 RepID=UPI0035256357
MGLFRSSELLGIAEETLEFVLEASRDAHPNEYMAFFQGTPAAQLDLDRSGTVITDVWVIPGTSSNSVSATVRENQIPAGGKAVGSVHSHPNGVLRPSDADLGTFHAGKVHVIVGAPYGRDDWRAFDRDGEPTELAVLEVPLPGDEAFFDFDQSDIDAELYDE